MRNIIEKLDMPYEIKQAYKKMADKFVELEPDSLYMSFYRIAEETDIPSEAWEKFFEIEEVDMYIEKKVAKLVEFDAREALQILGRGRVDGSQVSALKEIIQRSSQLQQTQPKPVVVLTHIPLD